MVGISCTHAWEMRPVDTIPGMGVRGIKEIMEGWIQLWYIVRISVNVTMYPKYNNKKLKIKVEGNKKNK
jgi:hypothetical protein